MLAISCTDRPARRRPGRDRQRRGYALILAAVKGGVDLDITWWAWTAVGVVVALFLAIDILVVHREAKEVGARRAGIESAIWIAIGVTFGVIVFVAYGGAAAGEWFSGYLIELSLSVDNVFVWALIFSFFAVPRAFQHRVLFWGIFGAVVLRALFIFAGVELINRFDWILYVFGGFLLFTAFRLVTQGEAQIDPSTNPFLRLVRRLVPSTDSYDGQHLFTHQGGRRLATPLFAVLVLVETTDVLFAVDSVPAVLAVSREQFIVLTSNAFAILGLRALYFLLADMHARFKYLQHGLALILAFVGVKMITSHWFHMATWISLLVIAVVLSVSVVASLRWGPNSAAAPPAIKEPPPIEER